MRRDRFAPCGRSRRTSFAKPSPRREPRALTGTRGRRPLSVAAPAKMRWSTTGAVATMAGVTELERLVESSAPDPFAIQAQHRRLLPFVRETPVWSLEGHRLRARVDASTEVVLKLELFQHTGSFKPRGALTVMQSLTRQQLDAGVT